jgi:hypothetical protein
MLALRDLMRPIGDNNTLQPVCPICSRALRLTRTTPATAEATALNTYGWQTLAVTDVRESGAPYGNRTRVSAVKGRRPGPLDEGRFTTRKWRWG